MMPYLPTSITLRIMEKGEKKISIWLPFLVLWPLMLLFFPIITVFGLGHTMARRNMKSLKSVMAIWPLFFSLKGLLIDVESKDSKVFIEFK